MKTLKWLFEFSIIAILSFVMAYLFLEGWDREQFVLQAKAGKRYEVLNAQAREATTPPNTHYREASERRKHHYQDAGR